jgi:hypothetical protein
MDSMTLERGAALFTAAASRDEELVRFLGRHGVASVAHVMHEFEIGRTAAYRLAAACVERGLIERDDSLRREPSVLYATREGLRWAGLAYPVAKLSPSLIRHGLRCTSTAQALGREFPGAVHTERDLCRIERQEGRPIASAKMGTRPDGGPRLHRPDLALVTEAGVIAVEVELTAKAPRRLEGIMRAWRRSPWVSGVRYYCEPGATRRAVERAILATRSGERVRVFEAVAR